jgi:dUTP pyrophosphatase
MNLPIKIKKLSPDAVIPTYKHEDDAGFDLVAAEEVIIESGKTTTIKTGLSFNIPEGYEMQIRPRSGITAKTHLQVELGTIDSGYHGEIGVITRNLSYSDFEYLNSEYVHLIDGSREKVDRYYWNYAYKIKKGDRIAQAVIAPVVHAEFEEVDKLGDSERGSAGFGSTGVKS